IARAEALLRRPRHEQADCSLLMIHVDHVRTINETWGRGQGDRALAALAQPRRHSLRPQDANGRFGGQEFLVALPDTHPKDALMVAERLQWKVSELEVMEGTPDHRLTVTVGIAGGVDEDVDLDTLIQQADRALYAGKHGGRNRVIVSEEVS